MSWKKAKAAGVPVSPGERGIPDDALESIAELEVWTVFWRSGDRIRCRAFEDDDYQKAKRLALRKGTVVIATKLGVPRIALTHRMVRQDGEPPGPQA